MFSGLGETGFRRDEGDPPETAKFGFPATKLASGFRSLNAFSPQGRLAVLENQLVDRMA
jgi:hypothetical protein